jgi:hypothetical protein
MVQHILFIFFFAHKRFNISKLSGIYKMKFYSTGGFLTAVHTRYG